MESIQVDFNKVCRALIESGAKTATLYIDKNLTLKATYRFKPNKKNRRQEMVVTFGKPNYAEREFIKSCNKAGEPMPVKRVQLKMWPKKK